MRRGHQATQHRNASRPAQHPMSRNRVFRTSGTFRDIQGHAFAENATSCDIVTAFPIGRRSHRSLALHRRWSRPNSCSGGPAQFAGQNGGRTMRSPRPGPHRMWSRPNSCSGGPAQFAGQTAGGRCDHRKPTLRRRGVVRTLPPTWWPVRAVTRTGSGVLLEKQDKTGHRLCQARVARHKRDIPGHAHDLSGFDYPTRPARLPGLPTRVGPGLHALNQPSSSPTRQLQAGERSECKPGTRHCRACRRLFCVNLYLLCRSVFNPGAIRLGGAPCAEIHKYPPSG